MTDHICPKDIQDDFERDPDYGRGRIIEWMKGLPLKTGDQIWSPEGGWFTKTNKGLQ